MQASTWNDSTLKAFQTRHLCYREALLSGGKGVGEAWILRCDHGVRNRNCRAQAQFESPPFPFPVPRFPRQSSMLQFQTAFQSFNVSTLQHPAIIAATLSLTFKPPTAVSQRNIKPFKTIHTVESVSGRNSPSNVVENIFCC